MMTRFLVLIMHHPYPVPASVSKQIIQMLSLKITSPHNRDTYEKLATFFTARHY